MNIGEYPETESADEPMTLEAMVRENTKKLDELVEWVTRYVREQIESNINRSEFSERALSQTANRVADLIKTTEQRCRNIENRFDDIADHTQTITGEFKRDLSDRIKAIEEAMVGEDDELAKLTETVNKYREMVRDELARHNELEKRVVSLEKLTVEYCKKVAASEDRMREIGDVTQTHTRMFMGVMSGIEGAIPMEEEPDDEPKSLPEPAAPPKPKPPDESTLQPMNCCTLEAYLCFSGDNAKAVLDACNRLTMARVKSWLNVACVVTGYKPNRSPIVTGNKPSTNAYPVALLRLVAGYLKGLWHPTQPMLSRNGLINHLIEYELSANTKGKG